MVVATLGEARVPAPLPRILKDYTKAAIRTQPKDLLAWSAAYFRCMSKGTAPPVKDRLEFPIPEAEGGMSPGVLRVFHRQLKGVSGGVTWRQVEELCAALGVAQDQARDAWRRAGGSADGTIEWHAVLSHLAAVFTSTMVEALQLVMMAVTEEPVSQRVSCATLLDHYHRLFKHSNTTSEDQYNEAVSYLNDIANYQDGYLTPSDLTRSSCPSLQ
ncbi:ropporin-1-like protein isoform X2 [Panulirus ornatus]